MATQDVIGGLFGLNPYQVQQQQYAQDEARAAQMAQMGAAQRGVQGLMQGGAGLARLGAGMMGMQNPEVERAKKMQQAQSGLDLQSPEGLLEAAKRFQQIGEGAIANGLIKQAYEYSKKLGEIGELSARTGKEQAQTQTAFMTDDMKMVQAIERLPEGSPARVALESRLATKDKQYLDEGEKLARSRFEPGTPEYQDFMKKWSDARLAQMTKPGGTVINMSNLTGKDMASKVGDILKEGQAKANAANQTLAAADRLDAALDSNKVLTGPLAEKAVTLKQFFDRTGGDTNGTINQTRQAVQALAQYNLLSREALKGQGQVTENEAAAAAKAMGGDIESMTIQELRFLNSVIRKMSRYTLNDFNRKIKYAESLPEVKPLVPFFSAGNPEDLNDPNTDLRKKYNLGGK